MTVIQLLSSQAWVERLGWTLVHFLWQGLLIAMTYIFVRRSLRTANARYLLACAALAAMAAAPVATWCALQPSSAAPDAVYRIRTAPPAPSAIPATAGLPDSLRFTVRSAPSVVFLPWVVMVWLAGAAAFWVRLAGGWVVASRIRRMLVRRAPPEWQRTLNHLAGRIGLTRPVRLLVSALVQVPTVVGWLRPVVLMPVGALSGLDPEYLEVLLLHELAHIGRHDYLVNMLQSAAEALLFYHPAVWWVSGHIRAERELCCDDVAVSISGDVLTYARALAELESYRPAAFRAALAANGGSLRQRIARLLGRSQPAPRTGLGPSVLTVAVMLAMAAYGVFAQSDSHPAFQVASVKRNTAAARHAIIVRVQPGGRLTAEDAPLLLLIQNAYQVQAFQVVGGPAWINSDGYDIEAKPEGSVERKDTWRMLQTLLADRFKLTLHRATRELPVYALTVAKGGARLPQAEGVCASPDTPEPNPAAPPCGALRIGKGDGGLNMRGDKVPIAELARITSMAMGRPVVDRTGLRGAFDINLSFTPDENTMGLAGAGGPHDPGGMPPPPPTDANRPNIFAALEEQLGLKLASSKGPVEVLVIDHVERPTGN